MPIVFEAHYWGRFRLTALPGGENAFSQIPYPIAQRVDVGAGKSILFDPMKEAFFLSHQPHRPIASSLEEFIPSNKLPTWDQSAEQMVDLRKSLEDLLPIDAFLNTHINDPEHFDDPEAYVAWVEFCEKLSEGLLSFDKKEVHQLTGEKKQLILERGNQQWEIILERELFDRAVLDWLNEIVRADKNDFQLYYSLNSRLEMILLKLNRIQFEQLESMGMLL